MRGLEADVNGAEAHLHAWCGHIRAIAPPYCQTQRSPVMYNDARLAPQSAITRSLHFHAECAHSVVFFLHRMKIDVTGGEASSIPTNWPAAVTFPIPAMCTDRRSAIRAVAHD